MSFILEIGFVSHQQYVGDYLGSFFEEQEVDVNVSQIGTTVIVEANREDPNLEGALHALNETMPYSLFKISESHRHSETPFQHFKPSGHTPLPLNLGLCGRCKAEMLDPLSRRYYYPFTGCRHCGAQYAFFERFPYVRANTGFGSVPTCPECETERRENPFRRDYPLIGCHNCHIPLEISYQGEVRYARDAKSCKALFETAARAVDAGGTLVMKTTFGYRRFYRAGAENITAASKLLHINSHTLMQDLFLTKEEIESLFSLEKPLLKAAVQCEKLKGLFGDTLLCKVPDEAFTILLGTELLALGMDYIAYEECNGGDAGECTVTFDLPMNIQSDLQLFIGKDARCIKKGERVSFPAEIATPVDTLSVTDTLVALNSGRNHLIDRREHFEGMNAGRMNLLEGCESGIEVAETRPFSAAQGALRGALASHKRTESAVGVYLEGGILEFLRYDGSGVVSVVPPVPFEPKRLIDKLTEFSERTVANLEESRPELYAELQRIEQEGLALFEAASAIIGLTNSGFDALDDAALAFTGSGRAKLEMTLTDTRFNPYVLIASIIGYRMAGAEPAMLAFSLFSSMGNYFAEILTLLQSKTNAVHVVLCGEQIAQATLYERIEESMKVSKPLLNRSFPIGKEGAVVGGIYL